MLLQASEGFVASRESSVCTSRVLSVVGRLVSSRCAVLATGLVPVCRAASSEVYLYMSSCGLLCVCCGRIDYPPRVYIRNGRGPEMGDGNDVTRSGRAVL